MVRKLLVALESKMAHLLMVSMLMLTVQRRVVTTRAFGWVGMGQEGNIYSGLDLYYLYCPPLPTSPCWPQSTHEDFTKIMMYLDMVLQRNL